MLVFSSALNQLDIPVATTSFSSTIVSAFQFHVESRSASSFSQLMNRHTQVMNTIALENILYIACFINIQLYLL